LLVRQLPDQSSRLLLLEYTLQPGFFFSLQTSAELHLKGLMMMEDAMDWNF